MASDRQRSWNRKLDTPTFGRVAKLTPQQRDEIVRRYREGGEGNSLEELAIEFRVTVTRLRELV